MTRTARSIGMRGRPSAMHRGCPIRRAPRRATWRPWACGCASDFPKEFAYFSRPSFTYGGRVVRTHNRLLGRMRGVDGIKTGYTRASGFNLVTSAGRDGRRLVGVVMGGASGGARNRYMAAMLETAFPKAGRGKIIALAAGRPPGFNAAAAVAVAAATSDPPPARMQLAGVPVPRPKPETEEPDMALVPAEVAADSGEDEEAVAQESARLPISKGGEAASRPSGLRSSRWNSQAPRQRSRRPRAPPPESAPQGDFGHRLPQPHRSQ